MGIRLVEEVMDWCPEDVSTAQRWCLTVLARDANELSRETWHGPEHPEILRRVRMSPKKWEAMRSVLLKRGLIEPVSGGFRGRAARYRIASLYGPCVVQDWRKTPLQRGAFGGYAPKVNEKDPPKTGGQSAPKTPQDQGVNLPKDPPKTGGPTPPSTSPPSVPPPAPSDPLASPDLNGGGGGQQQDEQQAEGFLQSLPSPWGVGRKTARELTPLLLERAAEQGWQLDDELTRWLSRNLGPVRTTHASVLRARIDDLPKKPTAKTRDSPGLPQWCTKCGDDFPEQAATNARFRKINGKPCEACHPSAVSRAA